MRPGSGGGGGGGGICVGGRPGCGGGDRLRPGLLALHILFLAASALPRRGGEGAGPGALDAAVPPGCPQPNKALKARTVSQSQVQVVFTTDIEDVDLSLVWLSETGNEKELLHPSEFTSSARVSQTSFPGHVLRIYAQLGAAGAGEHEFLLVSEYEVTRETKQSVHISTCKELEDAVFARFLQKASTQELLQRQKEHVDQLQRITSELSRRVSAQGAGALSQSPPRERKPHFEALRHRGGEGGGEYPACEPAGRSSRWSCVRRWPSDKCKQRHQNVADFTEGNTFGFDAPQGKWVKGSYEDQQYDWQQPRIPRMSQGPGFLVMNMTDRLRDALLPWYAKEANKSGALQVERPVPGAYINDEQVRVHHLNLDRYPELRKSVVREMQEILEWWAGGVKLRHTATFGARVYRRGNVLLNHVDRMDTHLVSAILQLHQEVDEDGGWPVEVLSEDKDCFEVYLQPGEMVLYEGARFKHGRPMAFRGEAFANVFTHFAPVGWTGLSNKKEL